MHDLGDTRTVEAWFRALPPLTRFNISVIFIVTLVYTFNLLNPYILLLDWSSVLFKGHIWRLFTDYYVIGRFSFSWITHMYLLTQFSGKLENTIVIDQSPGSYLLFLIFQMLSLDILAFLLQIPAVLAPSLLMATIYYWSRKEPFGQCTIWGFQLPAYQFPFALLFLQLILGQNLMVGLMGLATGHFYYFIKDVLPRERGVDILKTTPFIFDEIMRRAALFDIGNVQQSLRYIILGKPAEVRVNRSGNMERRVPVPSAGQARAMFSGAGQRLGSRD